MIDAVNKERVGGRLERCFDFQPFPAARQEQENGRQSPNEEQCREKEKDPKST
jgi:hypothetical protein